MSNFFQDQFWTFKALRPQRLVRVEYITSLYTIDSDDIIKESRTGTSFRWHTYNWYTGKDFSSSEQTIKSLEFLKKSITGQNLKRYYR